MPRRRNHFSLTSDQRVVLDMYVNLYNQTTRQLERLQEMQMGILQDIRNICNLRNSHSNSNPNPNPNSNQSRTENTDTREMYYDSQTDRYYINGVPYRLSFFRNDYYIPLPQSGRSSGNATSGTQSASTAAQNPSTSTSNASTAAQSASTAAQSASRRMNFTDALWSNFENLYTNVVVRPTAREIRHATRSLRYSQLETPLNASCPISLEPFEPNSQITQILGCGHLFNPSSLQLWFNRNVRCPICRYDIRTVLPRRAEPPLTTFSSSSESETSNTRTPSPSPTPSQSSSSATNSERESGSSEQEESKDEGPLEETKEDPVPEQAAGPRPSVMNELSSLTESILNQFLQPPSTGARFTTRNSQIYYDPSTNEIVFQGHY